MSIDRLRAHWGLSRTPFTNYAEAVTMPRRVRDGLAGRGP
jgi:hypothetical protein